VDALLVATKKGKPGERYILSGENITIQQLFARIAHFAGVKPPKVYMPDLVVHSLGKFGDIMERLGGKGPINSENAWTSTLYHWFDHSKATRELGFQPRSADEALRESVDWMKQKGLLE
jgi:dihydroflavonol-4-reductase